MTSPARRLAALLASEKTMDENEIAAAGDEFKNRVRQGFSFLLVDFGFDPAADESTAYAHRLTFRNQRRNQLVEVANAFHGVDYGFEINLYPACGPRLLDQRKMIHYCLKEEQDSEFEYLAVAAARLHAVLQGAA